MIKTYSELTSIDGFHNRLAYLRLFQNPSQKTFGSLRGLNQSFYASSEWRIVRKFVIVRDFGRDLGIEGREIFSPILVHHMNPVTPYDLTYNLDLVLDPEYLITTQFSTHQLIHYSRHDVVEVEERTPGDTTLWI